MTPKAGRITTSSAVSASHDSPASDRKRMPCAAQPLVDVRVVDDLAGEEHALVRELQPRLVGVVDGPVDAVAEAELAGEVHGEPALLVAVVAGLDAGDQFAVVVRGELAGDLALEVEPLLEDQ